MIIAFDLDGTTARFHTAIADHCRSFHGVDLPTEPDCWRYARPWMPDEEFEAAVVAFGDAGGFGSLAVYEDAAAGLSALAAAGHQLLAVTSRPSTPEVCRSTFRWVAALPWLVRGVLVGPGSKLDLEADLLFDDDPWTVDLVAEEASVAPVLIDRPWNRASPAPRLSWPVVPEVVAGLEAKLEGVPAGERRWVLADLVEEVCAV